MSDEDSSVKCFEKQMGIERVCGRKSKGVSSRLGPLKHSQELVDLPIRDMNPVVVPFFCFDVEVVVEYMISQSVLHEFAARHD
jgi:hypothetical protein